VGVSCRERIERLRRNRIGHRVDRIRPHGPHASVRLKTKPSRIFLVDVVIDAGALDLFVARRKKGSHRKGRAVLLLQKVHPPTSKPFEFIRDRLFTSEKAIRFCSDPLTRTENGQSNFTGDIRDGGELLSLCRPRLGGCTTSTSGWPPGSGWICRACAWPQPLRLETARRRQRTRGGHFVRRRLVDR